jgi:putative membrane protein
MSTIFMQTIAAILTGLVAIEHIYILWLEMFAWETRGRKVFRGSLSPELFTPTKTLAANQGLYNGFLAAGLAWSFFIDNPEWKTNISIFFLSCVIIAGIYGAITASKKIFFIQALPAITALVFTMLK